MSCWARLALASAVVVAGMEVRDPQVGSTAQTAFVAGVVTDASAIRLDRRRLRGGFCSSQQRSLDLGILTSAGAHCAGDADQGVMLAALRDLALIESKWHLLLAVGRKCEQPIESGLVLLDVEHLASPVVARHGEVARLIVDLDAAVAQGKRGAPARQLSLCPDFDPASTRGDLGITVGKPLHDRLRPGLQSSVSVETVVQVDSEEWIGAEKTKPMPDQRVGLSCARSSAPRQKSTSVGVRAAGTAAVDLVWHLGRLAAIALFVLPHDKLVKLYQAVRDANCRCRGLRYHARPRRFLSATRWPATALRRTLKEIAARSFIYLQSECAGHRERDVPRLRSTRNDSPTPTP